MHHAVCFKSGVDRRLQLPHRLPELGRRHALHTVQRGRARPDPDGLERVAVAVAVVVWMAMKATVLTVV